MTAARADDGRRVVVTGLGAVTPIGETPGELFASLLAGRSAIRRLTKLADWCALRIGGEMGAFDAAAHLARVAPDLPADVARRARRSLRSTPLSGSVSACAAVQAFADAGLPDARVPAERIGHALAGHNINTGYAYRTAVASARDPDDVDVLYGLMTLDTDVCSVASEILAIMGPSCTVGGACASGNLALLTAVDWLRAGRADVVLVTGASTDLDPLILHSWSNIHAVSTASFNDDPARASRPFDARREGFVPSELAGAVVLETLAHAHARGAAVHGELLGVGAASDACRRTKPDLGGQTRAIRAALADARVAPDAVDYVNAHAASTPLGDATEVESLRAVLGAHARAIPVNATKSMTGHGMTAANVVELIATLLQMRHGVLHATINQEEADAALDLDFVPNAPREHRPRVALSNGFGFGGINACAVVGAAPW